MDPHTRPKHPAVTDYRLVGPVTKAAIIRAFFGLFLVSISLLVALGALSPAVPPQLDVSMCFQIGFGWLRPVLCG